jgi:hypothetical protein
MNTTRRGLLRIATGGAMSLGAFSPTFGVAESPISRSQAVSPLRVLVLGGTGFIGPHQVRYAMSCSTILDTCPDSRVTPRPSSFRGFPPRRFLETYIRRTLAVAP